MTEQALAREAAKEKARHHAASSLFPSVTVALHAHGGGVQKLPRLRTPKRAHRIQ
ncbi:MAG: hypothetical protein ABIU05_05680 [Nitrospirales bacterium]